MSRGKFSRFSGLCDPRGSSIGSLFLGVWEDMCLVLRFEWCAGLRSSMDLVLIIIMSLASGVVA